MDIKWSVGISYTDISERRLFAKYVLNARNKNMAEDLAKELFIMEHGVCDSISTIVEPEHLTSEDMKVMLNVKDDNFRELDRIFSNKTYKDFTIAFQQFDGFSAYLSAFDDSFFWLTFLNMTVKAVFKVNGECYIDTKEVYYKDEFGKKMVARNSWTEYYYCT